MGHYMKDYLKDLHSARGNQHHNSPIKVDGDQAIKYKVVRDSMETKTNIEPVYCRAAEEYLADIYNGTVMTKYMIDEATGKVRLTLF